ncbi:hypothetical protein [Nocardiopsis rhodophaea]|uniref:hypothetical protein n=1 Tax=Nocardiopsis rhodophaea TaxID=280238 RepID=UPI0031D0682E
MYDSFKAVSDTAAALRIIVTGGRNYNDRDTVHRILAEYPGRHTLVNGACKVIDAHGRYHRPRSNEEPGADRLATEYALGCGWDIAYYPPHWRQYGRAAGPVRNRWMVEDGADLVIAFPGGSGTAHLVREAEKAGIPVRRI